jgi:flagellar hook-length control protein FliK
MPQMLAIQPVVPKAPPSGSPGNKEQSQFSPHLENAISSKKAQQQAPQDKDVKKTSPSADKDVSTDGNSQSLEAQEPETNATTGIEDLPETVEKNAEQTNLTPLSSETTQAPATSSIFSVNQIVESSAHLLEKTATVSGNGPNTPEKILSAKILNASAIQPESPLTLIEPEPAVPNSIKPALTGKQDALISQLQQIIDNSNETGLVSISRATNTSSPNSLRSNLYGVIPTSFQGNSKSIAVNTTDATAEFNLNGLLVADGEGLDKAGVKQPLHPTGTRMDMQQQYFNAKITTLNPAQDNQNFKENQQGNELFQQTLSSNLQSGPLGATEQTNTFSQISALVQDTTAQPANESAKPILLPSGTIVHEEEIIRQLTDKFQLSGKNMDTRINLKLHPAELGELKIDLTVKEGSIKANIVAQSQQALEILEKNIHKLKALLENQGFSINQISITADSESVNDFDLFDRQLFSQNDYTPKTQKGSREAEAVFTLEDNINAAPESNTGVNVKI